MEELTATVTKKPDFLSKMSGPTPEEISKAFEVDLDAIKDLKTAKQIIADLRDKNIASRQDLALNFQRLKAVSTLLKTKLEESSRTEEAHRKFIESVLDDPSTTKVKEILHELIERYSQQTDRSNKTCQEILISMLAQGKEQIEGAFSNFSREMNRMTFDISKMLSDSRSIREVLIPLARRFPEGKFSCSDGNVYMDLTRPENPEGAPVVSDDMLLAEYEYGIDVKISPAGTEPTTFTVRPEFQKEFQPPSLVLTVGTIEETFAAVEFVRANIEPEILKYLRSKEDTTSKS